MRFTIKVEWEQEDGTVGVTELGRIEADVPQSAAEVGIKLSDAQPILVRLQTFVTAVQVRKYCESVRSCPGCRTSRNVKDYRERRLHTVFGKIVVRAPRFERCQTCECSSVYWPLTELFPQRVLPEMHHLQAELASELSYSRAATVLRRLLATTDGLTAATTRNRTVALGRRIERELNSEVDCPTMVARPVSHLTIGIDGAFVKSKPDESGKRQFEILTGLVERTRGQGHVFAVVRTLDSRAKQKVQAVLRQCGRGPDTDITLLSDGEDGLRGVVGWFGRKCRHRLDWFHIRRRFEKLHRDLLYLPHRENFREYLSLHSRNLVRVMWSLWNQGIEMADWYMKIFRCGLVEDAWDHPEVNISCFQAIEKKLDELRSHLYAHSKAVSGYSRAFRRGERVGTSHVESTVNQLINWRFCKKQQMSWSKNGAQALLHVKTAGLNGTLHRYTRNVGAIAA